MREAVIVSTARTPIGRAYRGAFNDTQAQALGGHAIAEAVKRAGVDPGEIDDVIMGAALAAGRAGLQRRAPERAARRPAGHASPACRSTGNAPPGMMAIATAAKEIMTTA